MIKTPSQSSFRTIKIKAPPAKIVEEIRKNLEYYYGKSFTNAQISKAIASVVDMIKSNQDYENEINSVINGSWNNWPGEMDELIYTKLGGNP